MNFCKACGFALKAIARHSQAGVISPPAPAAPAPRVCTSCGRSTPAVYAFCQNCGAKLPAVSAARPMTAVAHGRLLSLLPTGADGPTFPLDAETVDFGRAELADDPSLAARHFRLERKGGATFLTPLDRVNGVFLRLRAGQSHKLVDGDHLLAGRHLFRYESVSGPAAAAAAPHGVRLVGTRVRPPWGRLTVLLENGMPGDVHHLAAAEVVIGRDEGDLRFPDDEHLSRKHARLRPPGELGDAGSANGTFVRLRGETELTPGDVLRAGGQVLRFEPVLVSA
jgi:pSer/pThr/pTyr-binding forkhead associated (FHA) protein